jgi:hypothetical protein
LQTLTSADGFVEHHDIESGGGEGRMQLTVCGGGMNLGFGFGPEDAEMLLDQTGEIRLIAQYQDARVHIRVRSSRPWLRAVAQL